MRLVTISVALLSLSRVSQPLDSLDLGPLGSCRSLGLVEIGCDKDGGTFALRPVDASGEKLALSLDRRINPPTHGSMYHGAVYPDQAGARLASKDLQARLMAALATVKSDEPLVETSQEEVGISP